MTDLPEPLIPSDCDLKDFPFTPLFRARLFGSSFHARSNDSEWRAGVTLWLRSWDQVPAGSLPDDDVELCRLAELGRDMKTWKKLRAGSLRGWIKCRDGRLYHPVVAEGVLEAWQGKQAQRDRTKKAREARLSQRQSRPEKEDTTEPVTNSVTDNVTSSVTDTVTSSKRKGKGKGQLEDSSEPHSPTNPAALLDNLEDRCRFAAGLETDPSPGLLVIGPIADLIEAGWSLEAHVLPSLRAAKAAGKRGKTWAYYAKIITNGAERPPSPPPPPDGPQAQKLVAGLPEANCRAMLQAWEEGHWSMHWGNEPKTQGCRIPLDFVERWEAERWEAEHERVDA